MASSIHVYVKQVVQHSCALSRVGLSYEEQSYMQKIYTSIKREKSLSLQVEPYNFTMLADLLTIADTDKLSDDHKVLREICFQSGTLQRQDTAFTCGIKIKLAGLHNKDLEVTEIGSKIHQNKTRRTTRYTDRGYKPITLVAGNGRTMKWDMFQQAEQIICEADEGSRLCQTSFREHLYDMCERQGVPYYHSQPSPSGRYHKLYSCHSSRKMGAMLAQISGMKQSAGGWLNIETAHKYCGNILQDPQRVLGNLDTSVSVPRIPLKADAFRFFK